LVLLEVQNLTKDYVDKTVLHNVNLSLEKGQVYGLLGPNGAGKTSLIRIITGIIDKGQGTLLWKKKPLTSKHLNLIGYLPEERGVYSKMRVGEYLRYLGNLRGLNKETLESSINSWLDQLTLLDRINDEIGDLSKGNQQKVQFIAAVLHEPELLILDEPLSGFDPANELVIINTLLKLREEGCTILLSTHRMDSVEDLCDNILFLNKGKIVYSGRVSELRSKYQTENYFVDLNDQSEPLTLTAEELASTDIKKINSLHREQKTFKEIFIELTNA
jgi:ABC-2 type transport system ATP-binding protein